jgi:capsular exopolysaccharide synthesis family protein
VTPREYIEIVRERWRAIVAGLLLGLVVAGGLVYLVPREYSANVTVLVAAQSDASATTADTGEISSQRLGTYVELLRSRRLAGGVISDLRLPTTPDELADRVSVTTTPDSLLLTATVTDGSPDGAIRIANALADEFIRNVAEIEQPSDQTRPPSVVAKAFEPAQPPAEQVAPRPVRYLILGTVLGLLAGFAAALLRNGLDTTLRRRSQLEDILGAPVLGVIGRDSKIASSPLVIYGDPQAPLAEAFRQLRTNVQFTDIDSAHKLILVTSPSWGEGKTTTVCNLALALAEAGTSVLIIDADLRRASVASSLSIEKRVGLTDVLVGRIPIEQAVQPLAPALDVLPSGPLPPNPSELLCSTRMIKLIAGLRLMYEVVLIDTAPLLPVTDAAVLAPRVDGVLVLVRHGHTLGRDLRAAKDALDAVSSRIIGSVMTMVPHAGKRAGRRRKPRKGIRQQRPYGPVPGTGPGGETGSAVPGSALRQAAAPQPAAPQPAAPLPASPQPAAPLPAPRQPSPAPRPPEPSDSGAQVLDRGPAAR